jgi:hypothetical protein
LKIVDFFFIIWGKLSELEPEPEIFDKLEPELKSDKNGSVPQHCFRRTILKIKNLKSVGAPELGPNL